MSDAAYRKWYHAFREEYEALEAEKQRAQERYEQYPHSATARARWKTALADIAAFHQRELELDPS